MSDQEFERTHKPGERLTAKLINSIKAEIRRNRVRVAGADQVQTAGGMLVRPPATGAVEAYYIKTPSGGIAAPSGGVLQSAECEVYHVQADGTPVATGVEITVFNGTGGAITGNRMGGAIKRIGCADYMLDWVEC